MSADDPATSSEAGGRDVARDDEYIEGYSKGYGDGLREALREVRAHTARGASPQELRMIIESRLARIPEDVEVRRKGLLAPPRRPPWTSLLRPAAAPTTWAPPRTALPSPAVAPGTSVLVREARPDRAVELLRRSAPNFRRVVLVSRRPPEIPGANVTAIVPAARAGGDGGRGALEPEVLAGQIDQFVSEGSVLTYLDEVEFLTSEYGVGPTIQILQWFTSRAIQNGSAVVACLHPNALNPRELSTVERAFQIVR
jgi:hypothetical protein